MKKINLWLVGAALMFSTATQAQNNWISKVSDSQKVFNLTIPCTHGSTSAEGWLGESSENLGDIMGLTQSLSMEDQWKLGVRGYEILTGLYENTETKQKDLYTMQSMFTTKVSLRDFFTHLATYLKENPTELAVVILDKSAATTSDIQSEWNAALAAIINSDELKDLFVPFKSTITVGEMRGKIMLLSKVKYADSFAGGFVENWTLNEGYEDQMKPTITAPDGTVTKFYAQDFVDIMVSEYEKKKQRAIKLMFDYVAKRDVNAKNPIWAYAGLGGGISTDGYRQLAVLSNHTVIEYLNTTEAQLGLISIDYAGVDNVDKYEVKGLELLNAIIAHNPLTETAIGSAKTAKADNNNWYTLQGAELQSAPTKAGIYVHGDKKVIVR